MRFTYQVGAYVGREKSRTDRLILIGSDAPTTLIPVVGLPIRVPFGTALRVQPGFGALSLGITTGNILGAALLSAAVGYSTKQVFTSLHKWDDALIHKKHLKEDLGQTEPDHLQDKPAPSGTLPDLSHSGMPLHRIPQVKEHRDVPHIQSDQPVVSRKNRI